MGAALLLTITLLVLCVIVFGVGLLGAKFEPKGDGFLGRVGRTLFAIILIDLFLLLVSVVLSFAGVIPW